MLPGPEPCRFCHFAMVSGGAKNLKIEARDSKSSDLGKLVFPLSTPIDEGLGRALCSRLRPRGKIAYARRAIRGFRPYAGECGSPLAFVVDKNLNRCPMTESQRAVLATKPKSLFEEEAQLRQRAGRKAGK